MSTSETPCFRADSLISTQFKRNTNAWKRQGPEGRNQTLTRERGPEMIITVDFHERLTHLRHDQGLTQAALAERVGIHVSQICRYEQGAAQPTLDVIRRLTTALNTNADQLSLDPDEHDAANSDWHLRVQAIQHLHPDEQAAIRTAIDGILPRHQAREIAS